MDSETKLVLGNILVTYVILEFLTRGKQNVNFLTQYRAMI